MRADKQPLGLKPWYIVDTERAREILAAMDRFLVIGKPVPKEWMTELQGRIRTAINPNSCKKRND